MINFFNKNKIWWRPTNKNLLIDFSHMHVGHWQVTAFLYFLYKEYNCDSIVADYHDNRCYLHYYGEIPLRIKQYFNDRNPAQIEELCKTLPLFNGTVEYVDCKNGYKQIVFKEKEVSNERKKKKS